MEAELILHTDAFDGLTHHTLRREANSPLRKILLLAAEHDIKTIPRWIPSQQNGLADALSRFDESTVANLCPHWQDPGKCSSHGVHELNHRFIYNHKDTSLVWTIPQHKVRIHLRNQLIHLVLRFSRDASLAGIEISSYLMGNWPSIYPHSAALKQG